MFVDTSIPGLAGFNHGFLNSTGLLLPSETCRFLRYLVRPARDRYVDNQVTLLAVWRSTRPQKSIAAFSSTLFVLSRLWPGGGNKVAWVSPRGGPRVERQRGRSKAGRPAANLARHRGPQYLPAR